MDFFITVLFFPPIKHELILIVNIEDISSQPVSFSRSHYQLSILTLEDCSEDFYSDTCYK